MAAVKFMCCLCFFLPPLFSFFSTLDFHCPPSVPLIYCKSAEDELFKFMTEPTDKVLLCYVICMYLGLLNLFKFALSYEVVFYANNYSHVCQKLEFCQFFSVCLTCLTQVLLFMQL